MEKHKRFGISEHLNLATWNVRSLINELVKLEQDISVLTETKNKQQATKDLSEYLLIVSGVDEQERAKAGAGLIIYKKWQNRIRTYEYINKRILKVRCKIGREYSSVIGVYSPKEGRKQDNVIFYENTG